MRSLFNAEQQHALAHAHAHVCTHMHRPGRAVAWGVAAGSTAAGAAAGAWPSLEGLLLGAPTAGWPRGVAASVVGAAADAGWPTLAAMSAKGATPSEAAQAARRSRYSGRVARAARAARMAAGTGGRTCFGMLCEAQEWLVGWVGQGRCGTSNGGRLPCGMEWRGFGSGRFARAHTVKNGSETKPRGKGDGEGSAQDCADTALMS